jgi:hypothetical protein
MPFICNNEVVDLTTRTSAAKKVIEWMNDLKEKYNLDNGGFVHFVYPDGVVRASKDNPGKMDKPRGMTIDWSDILYTPTGAERWLYYETVKQGKGDTKVYVPGSFEFTGSMRLGVNNIEKIIFLICISSRMQAGENNSSRRKYIKVYDEIAEATKQVKQRQEKSYISSLIYSGELGGLSEEQIRKISAMFYISDAADRNINLLRVALEKVVEHEKDGYDKFYEYAGIKESKSETPQMKLSIQKALDANIIGVETLRDIKNWKYKDRSGQFADMICRVRPGVNPNDYLVEYFTLNKDSYQMLKDIIQETLPEPEVDIVDEILAEPVKKKGGFQKKKIPV